MRERDLDAELRLHLQAAIDAKLASGLSEAEAIRQARAEFGGMESTKDQVRDVWRRWGWIDHLLKDIRYAARALWRNRGFAASAVVILTVGIAASTGLFAVLDALVLRPLPYADAERLARVQLVASVGRPRAATVTTGEFLALRQASALDAAYVTDSFTKALEGTEFPESVSTEYDTGNALPLLGVRPLIGRVFTEADAPIGSPPQRVAVLSQQFWQRHFAGQPTAIGQTLRLTGEPFTVIGVVSSESMVGLTDLILPLSMTFDPTERWPVTVRIKADASLTAAEADLQLLYQRFADTRRNDFPRGFRVRLRRLVDDERGADGVPIVSVLFGAAALLLVIGCVNVTILLFARGSHRVHELALRQALGATRGRLVSMLLCETLLLAVGAAALAVLLLTQVMPPLIAAAPYVVSSRAGRIAVGPTALLFATSATVLITVVAGLWPAWVVSHARSTAMRDASAVRAGGGRAGVGVGIVAVQVGVAVVLLAGTGAAIRSLLELYRAPLGFDPTHMTIAQLNLPEGHYTAWSERVRFYERLRSEIAATASVESSTLSLVPTATPPQVGAPTRIEADGLRTGDRDVWASAIAFDYFSTLRIPLVRGRMWSGSDDVRAEGVAVVNETLARQLWPNDDPIGKRIRDTAFTGRIPVWRLRAPGRDGWFSVIGVVRDTPNQGVREPVAPAMYYPYTAVLSDFSVLMIRTKKDPAAAERDLRVAVSRADAGLPIMRFISPEIFTGVRQERFVTVLLIGFGSVALLLASFGLFSVSYFSVARRTREFGIRIALGASSAAVLRSAIQGVVIAAAAGLITGLLVSVALNAVLARWSIHHVDHPVVLAAAAGALMVSTVAATVIPGRRATRIDPMTALRSE
jgi:putative ABC transport system permease protein